MDIFEQTSTQLLLFYILYGATGTVPLIAALYLLLRRGNAFAPTITPPVQLRRWAASFFIISVLSHLWWMLLYRYSADFQSLNEMLRSAGYVVAVMFDYVTLLTTIAGTLLSMLQDRKRPVWPVLAAMTPFVVLGCVFMVCPSDRLMLVAIVYILLLYVLFTIYMAFAVRRYGRWLRDNYADLERKEVWFTHVLSLVFMLLLILYALIDSNITMLCLLHFVELLIFILLLWRVETLPQLPSQERQPTANPVNIDLAQIERLLAEYCVGTQLYLQHDLTLQQLAQTIGTNRFYLSQYFSRQGITYNTYINNLRINHFITRYQEISATGKTVVAQQLASESGYRSYSTFSLAFKQRTGQSVTAWMHDMVGE